MPLTAEQIDQLRMPNPYQAPAPAPTGIRNPFMSMMGGGGNTGQPQGYNPDPRGMVDPAALQALAFGTEYDVEARRNAIAARLAENEMAAAQQGSQSGGGSADGLRANQMMTPYGPITRNNDPTSPLIGLMGVDPETGPTFF